mgnify:CR=1 FL=1
MNLLDGIAKKGFIEIGKTRYPIPSKIKKKIKEKQGKDVIIPFGFDKTFEPAYACEKQHPQIKGIMTIVSSNDVMINAQDLKSLGCKTNSYVVTGSTSNAGNFSFDKNAYFEKISKFLMN